MRGGGGEWYFFLPPDNKILLLFLRGREIRVLAKPNEGHSVYRVPQLGQWDARSHQKSLSPQEGTLAQGVASGEQRKKQLQADSKEKQKNALGNTRFAHLKHLVLCLTELRRWWVKTERRRRMT